MKFVNYFIDRPIFAAVLSALIVIAGAISIVALPVAEYPEVVPPSVVVRASYPGANPQLIAETVSAPLEQELVGVENLLHMYSQATMDGGMALTLTFAVGTDIERAQIQVQNRVAQALPRLPEEVRALGVSTVKSLTDLMMVVHLTSPDQTRDSLYLSNYAALHVRDELAKLPGMGDVRVFGAGDYSMRVWLEPRRLAELGITAADVVSAIREQNVQVAAGQLGGPPTADAAFQLAINAGGRLRTAAEFEDIIVKTGTDGEVVQLRDVARLEMGAAGYSLKAELNNEDALALLLYQAPGSSALELATLVRSTMDRLENNFPDGVAYSIVYDPTVFVRHSIKAVIKTLLEAIALVCIVVVLFLKTWRASIIPLVAVPVSIIGTCAVLHAFGFSINTLSLFGLVLSVGIVVDDAIVVVENVERNIEKGFLPMEATRRAMNEVSRPIIAITLVLCAVFVPVAFVDGLTGQFFRQFALTIAISTVISAFNSLTLSPALAALLLKSNAAQAHKSLWSRNRYVSLLAQRFDRWFGRAGSWYQSLVSSAVRKTTLSVCLYGGLMLLTVIGLKIAPTGFVPEQDKQVLIAAIQLPPGASLERTMDLQHRVASVAAAEPGVTSTVQFAGMSTNNYASSTSSAVMFFPLKPFEERETADLSSRAILGRLNAKFFGMKDAFVIAVSAPPVRGFGNKGGFKLHIEDRENRGPQALNMALQSVLMAARTTPQLANVFSNYEVNVPQLTVTVDRQRAKQQYVRLSDVYQTLQVYLGSLYVNDFNAFGRTYRVIAQAESPFRATVDDILQLATRNARGEMVPLGALVDVKQSYGPSIVERFNGFPAADVNGAAAAGFSSGEAQAAIAAILKSKLPPGFEFEWTELAYQQQESGKASLIVFPLCVLLVFLVLAAHYESLRLPLTVIFIVPLCVLAGLVALLLQHGDINIFTQVGFLVLIGLACKNAILMVDFANQLQMEGRASRDAILEAARLRLRPILMTSIAFIMGVVPLVLASGAGAEVRHTMGTVVFGGMIGVTLFGLVLTPVFYTLMTRRKAPARQRLELQTGAADHA